MIIAVDLDDVLADTLHHFIEFHNKEYGTKLKFEDFSSYDLHDIIGISRTEEAKRLEEFDKSVFFNDINPINGSQKAVSKLSKKHKIIIVTARTEIVREKTNKWIKKYFPEINELIFISKDYSNSILSKGKVCKENNVEVLIEDKIKHAKECVKEDVKVVLFNYPWNNQYNEQNGVTRVNSWKEILNLFN